jgi:4-hydroxy-3-polyprenylbenzoate decarboxylase
VSASGERIVVGVSGASGAIYAERLLKTLLENGHSVHLVLSTYGARLLKEERGLPGEPRALGEGLRERYGETIDRGELITYSNKDLGSALSSGSFVVHGMAVIPASMKTMASIAAGMGDTLIDRAAMVNLKEGRPLVLVPRETPLSRIMIENELRLHDAGATILPANPGFYQMPRSLEDLADFIAARVLDRLRIPPAGDLVPRWDPKS